MRRGAETRDGRRLFKRSTAPATNLSFRSVVNEPERSNKTANSLVHGQLELVLAMPVALMTVVTMPAAVVPGGVRARGSGSRRRTHPSARSARGEVLLSCCFRRAANRPCSLRKRTHCLCAALPRQATFRSTLLWRAGREVGGTPIGLSAGRSSGTLRAP